MILLNQIRGYVFTSIIIFFSLALTACGGDSWSPGGSNGGNSNSSLSLSLAAPGQYPANLPVPSTIVLTITNTSGVNASGLVYTVPNATNYTGENNITINPTGVTGNDCTTLNIGASCQFTATIAAYANPGAFTVVATPNSASMLSKAMNKLIKSSSQSISVTANLGLVNIPTTSNSFYILPGSETINANPNGPTTVLVSVLVQNGAANFDAINFIDGISGNPLTSSLVGESLSTAPYSINTYSITIPEGTLVQNIQALSSLSGAGVCITRNTGTNNNTACSNNAVITLVPSGVGILQIQPSYFNMGVTHESQVVTLVNTGNGAVSNIQLPNVSAPFSISSNNCGSSLSIGQKCTLVINYAANGTSGSGNLVFGYNNGYTASATIPYSSLIFGTQNGVIFTGTSLAPGAAAISIAPYQLGAGTSFNNQVGGLAVSGNNVYLASGTNDAENVYRSQNNGPWSIIGGGTAPDNSGCGILSIITVGSNVYIGTGGDGYCGSVFVSTANGSGAWSSLGGTGAASVYALASDSAGNIYAAAGASGVVIYTTTSNQWNPFGNGGPGNAAFIATDESSNNIYASDSNGIIYAIPAGATESNWNMVGLYPGSGFDGSGYGSSAITVDGSGNVYVASSQNNAVYVSIGGVESWTQFANGFPDNGVANSLIVQGDTLYAATTAGTVYSSTAGANWVVVTGNNLPYSTASAFIAFSGNTLYAAANDNSGFGYAYSSANASSPWSPVNVGSLDTNQISQVVTSGGNIYAGTFAGRVWMSTPGSSWNVVGGGVVPDLGFVNSIAVAGNNVYSGTSNGDVYLSTSGSSAWVNLGTESLSGVTGNLPVSSIALSGSNVYAAVSNNSTIYLLSSGAWQATTSGAIPGTPGIGSIVVSANTVYAGALDGNVWYSSNSGSGAWESVSGGPPPSSPPLSSVTVSGNSVYAGTKNGYVYLSVANGTWSAVGGGAINGNPTINSVVVSGTSIYAGASDGNIYVSVNGTGWVNTGYGNGSAVTSIASGS